MPAASRTAHLRHHASSGKNPERARNHQEGPESVIAVVSDRWSVVGDQWLVSVRSRLRNQCFFLLPLTFQVFLSAVVTLAAFFCEITVTPSLASTTENVS